MSTDNIIEKELSLRSTKDESSYCVVKKLGINTESKRLSVGFDAFGNNVKYPGSYAIWTTTDDSIYTGNVEFTSDSDWSCQVHGSFEISLEKFIIGKSYTFAYDNGFSREPLFTIDEAFLEWAGPVAANFFDDGRTCRHSYDSNYFCKVTDIRVNAEDNLLSLRFVVQGDNSMGPVQDPSGRELRDNNYSTVSQLPTLFESKTDEKIVGTLRFSLIHFKKGFKYTFSYGSNYSSIENFISFDDEFISSMGITPVSDVDEENVRTQSLCGECQLEGSTNHAFVYKLRAREGKQLEILFEARGENLQDPCGKEVKDSDKTGLPLASVQWNKKTATFHSGALVYDVSSFHRGESYYFSYGEGFSEIALFSLDNDMIDVLGLSEALPLVQEPMICRKNYRYYCKVMGIEADLSSNCLLIRFESYGNGSDGAIDGPSGSDLTGSDGSRLLQMPVLWESKDENRLLSGAIRIPLPEFKIGQDYNFQYGRYDYSTISSLFTMNDEFMVEKGIKSVMEKFAAGPQDLEKKDYMRSREMENYNCAVYKVSVDKSAGLLRVHLESRGTDEYGEVPRPEGGELRDNAGRSVPQLAPVWDIETSNLLSGCLVFDLTKLQRDEHYHFSWASDYSSIAIFITDNDFMERFGLQEMFPKRVETGVSRKNNYSYTQITSVEVTADRRLLIHFEAHGLTSVFGPISQPESYCLTDSEQMDVKQHPIVQWKTNKPHELLEGTFSYGLYQFKMGESYFFRHEYGYERTHIFTFDEEFIRTHSPVGASIELEKPDQNKVDTVATIMLNDSTSFVTIYKVTSDPANQHVIFHFEVRGSSKGPLTHPVGEEIKLGYSHQPVKILETRWVFDDPENVLMGSFVVEASQLKKRESVYFTWPGSSQFTNVMYMDPSSIKKLELEKAFE